MSPDIPPDILLEIPMCLGPDPHPAKPKFTAPAGTCDTHFHVFGPGDRFPYAAGRKYTPPDSPFESYMALIEAIGIERGVVVHPNLHGNDNAVTLDAIERGEGRFLGIVKVDGTTTRDDLKRLHGRGIRGVRFAFNPQHGGTFDGRLFDRVAAWCGDLGWQVELHMAPDDLARLAERMRRLPAPVVIDHMGRIDPSQGLAQEPFQVLLDLVREEHVWVKLSGADRLTGHGPPYADVVPFAQALIAAAPERMIWGSDWPHSAYFDAAGMPNDGDLFNLLLEFAPDDATRTRILVDNPARLFGY